MRASTLDRVVSAYAEAVANGDLEAAEGWIVTASYVADREAYRARAPKIGRTWVSAMIASFRSPVAGRPTR